MTYHLVCEYNNTREAETAYPSGTPEFISCFNVVRGIFLLAIVLSVLRFTDSDY